MTGLTCNDWGEYVSCVSGALITMMYKRVAAESRRQEEESGRYRAPIATEIAPAGEFWRAEERHQQYFEKRGVALARNG